MQAADLAQDAVDPITDAQKKLFRLEVDIRGILLDSIG